MRTEFNTWLKSDNVIKTGPDSYKTQCTQYVPTFNVEQLKKYFKKEFKN
jgi:hypothetical protein